MRRFAAISLGLHAVLLAVLLIWFGRGARPGDAPDKEGTVELVMVEAQGSGPPTAPVQPAPEASETKPPEQPAPAPPPPPQPVESTNADGPLPLPSPPVPDTPSPEPVQPSVQTPPVPAPPVQEAMQAPDIKLPGNDSETNAIVIGNRVIPASIDARSRNKEPVYPPDAVRRAEQGAVILLIHVSPEGLASGVDVLESSGHAVLDRAARDAVAAWHFRPAVKDGQPIPFDMPMRVTFQLE
ncbi:MAG: TonB family protein [Acetobacteraceae bacterium]|jgi:periplasmic protein TonB